MNRHRLIALEVTHPEGGASLVEYVLVLSLIVLVCLASLTAFGGSVGDSVDDSTSRIVDAG